MPDIGEAGQTKLRQASVFVAGLGGLGSISAYYLTAAGAGRIRAVDCDRVVLSNLNRQILHATADIDKWKTDSAQAKLSRLNPDCKLELIRETVTPDNAVELVQGCDLVLDATDNLAARKALNRAAIALQIPFIFGGIDGFTGMVTTFRPPRTACFECIFPDGPDKPEKPIGVLGPVAGLVATLQSIEAIKYILDLDEPLMNRLLRIDTRKMVLKQTELIPNDNCHICSGLRN
jgi:adenylyltransferase/sulfurtransferase